MSFKAKNYTMFKFVVFLLLSENALSLELGETPTEEREIQGELLKFKADKVTATSKQIAAKQLRTKRLTRRLAKVNSGSNLLT